MDEEMFLYPLEGIFIFWLFLLNSADCIILSIFNACGLFCFTVVPE
jgi:hypothetical protein